jgi:hypothetical protein
VLNYKKAQWDQIEKDLTETYKQLKKDQDKMSLDELWNIFKTNVQETIHVLELGFSFLILFFILGITFFLFIQLVFLVN